MIVLPAGLASRSFELVIEIWDPANRVEKEFKDRNGNVVRILWAGKGVTMIFTNATSSES